MTSKAYNTIIRRLYKTFIKRNNKFATHFFIASTGAKAVKSVKHPCHIVGGEYIEVS